MQEILENMFSKLKEFGYPNFLGQIDKNNKWVYAFSNSFIGDKPCMAITYKDGKYTYFFREVIQNV